MGISLTTAELRRHGLTLSLIGVFCVLGAGTAPDPEEESSSGEPGEGAEPSGPSGPRFGCYEPELSTCTEYGPDSRMATLGRDFFQETCMGEWREQACPEENLLADCHVADHNNLRDILYVYYLGGDSSIDRVVETCAELGGRVIRRGGAAVDPSITYPTLTVDGGWTAAEITADDEVEVQLIEGSSRQAVDIFRVELTAGQTYTLFVRRAAGDDASIQDLYVFQIDPTGHDLAAIEAFGPRLDEQGDGIVGRDFDAMQVTARESGPHAFLVRSGQFSYVGSDTARLERVHMGPYEVQVRAGAQSMDARPE